MARVTSMTRLSQGFVARVLLRFLLIGGCVGLALAGDSRNQEPARLTPETCTRLQGFSIPASSIGLPTSGALVQTAVVVGASENGNINGDFCKVTGMVKPH